MIKAIIVDDEPHNASYLASLVKDHLPEVTLLGTAHSVSQGLDLIRKTRPSLLFLDVELGTSQGFDLLEQLGEVNFPVIFTTAHQRYALTAIKFAALDYLLKPVDAGELKVAVDKAVSQLKAGTPDQSMGVLLENMRRQSEPKKMAIYTASGMTVITVKEILYLQSDGPYTHVYLKSGERITSSKHLKEYEELLMDYDFFRVHRSFIVNLAEIKHYGKADGGYILMSNAERVEVSSKKRLALMETLSSRMLVAR
jgi:two-component system, LytTR family, response regulator